MEGSQHVVATVPPVGLDLMMELMHEASHDGEVELVLRDLPPEARAQVPAMRAAAAPILATVARYGTMSTTPTGYLFDTADPVERRRLDANARMWDPFTFRTLQATGVGDGWRCLEIGAGTGTVAAWLLDRVGPAGEVVATDIETRWLEPMASANLIVRYHNVAADSLEHGGYDLVHARLVLEHLPKPERVVAKLVAALRPGGWLVVEDYETYARR